ncbi:CHASE2 and HATPase_c domain-containing protein [Xenophilus sp. Marseille-Q4582]|uniref:CHASE2 and HATPase_c domain-containing protein n=1 Tax=Xenophilus sp. Marseille-Q4582 TaxID=2866600 RepID=UPI001CE413CF|nr:CHASE2 and HATPase_c domain-containing protein [Xenophilus sp. Marseille-Q4582]
MHRRRGWLGFSLAVLLVTGVLAWLHPFTRIDRLLQDSPLAQLHERSGDEIVIVEFDDASLQALEGGPWRRAHHARLVQHIAAQQPRCIGLNLPLAEADDARPAENAALAQAMQGHCVVLPLSLQASADGTLRERAPAPALAAAASGIGHVHQALDSDGLVRSAYLQEGFEGRPWPHFVDALRRAGEARSGGAPALAHPSLPPPALPLGPWLRSDKQVLVLARDDPPLRRVSYVDVWRGHVPPDLFRNRYVLVGVTAPGAAEAYATPAPAEWAPRTGVEIFAHLLQSQLNGHAVSEAGPWQNLGFNLLPLAAVLLGLLRLRPAGVLALIAGMLLLRLGLHAARPWLGVQFMPAAGFIALLAVYPAWLGLRLMTALRIMRQATRQLHVELDGFPPPPAPSGSGDFLDRQMEALSLAVVRMRDVHRFARDGLEHLPDPTLVLNAQAQVLIANRAALRHWQAPALAGQDAHRLLADLATRSDGRPLVPAGALHHSRAPRLGEAVDAHGRVLLVRCVPFFDSRGAHAGWMVALVDISRMRQAQSQRDEALRFISHDIREPSAAVLTVLELVRTQPGLLTQQEMLERIRRHAQTGLELADGFVNVARAEVHAFVPEAVELVSLLQQAVDSAWVQGRARHVEVRMLQSPEEAWVLGDRGLLARALANVVSNALKYSPPVREVQCRIVEKPGCWAISVRDEGPGIAPELQSQLFRPFHRLHRDAHPDVHGVGLGLLLVRTVVQRHGGAVEIDSAANAGCTVTLVLPQPDPNELAALRGDLE